MQNSAGRFYYGWAVLAAAAVTELLAQGATSYASGLFVLPLQAEFHISRANANSSILILFLGAALMAPLVGKYLDRWPVRRAVPLGGLLFGASLAGIAVAPSLWIMALILLVPCALGYMAISSLMSTTLVARWFWRRRGLAMGIAVVATSGGGLVVVPLLARAIAAHGWRTALVYEAVIITAIILLAALLMRDRPRDMGLAAHPENDGRIAAEPVAHPGWRAVLSRRAFWIPALAQSLISGISQALVVTIVPYAVALGVPAVSAAFYISAFAIAAAATKIVAGLLADRIDLNRLVQAAILFLILSQLLLLLVPSHDGLLGASVLGGVALGWVLPTSAGLVARDFGSASFGAVMGWAYTLTALMAIAATRFIGGVFDASHAYTAAFATFLVLGVVVFLLTLILTRRRNA
jgi:MFS family permease